MTAVGDGQPSSGAGGIQGFPAKDGQTILEAMSALYPLISGNDAKPLLVIGSADLPSYQKALSGVPRARLRDVHGQALGQPDGRREGSPGAEQPVRRLRRAPGLPAADLTALRQAFAKAAALPALKQRAEKESLPLAWIDGSSVSGQVSTALSASSSIAPYVK